MVVCSSHDPNIVSSILAYVFVPLQLIHVLHSDKHKEFAEKYCVQGTEMVKLSHDSVPGEATRTHFVSRLTFSSWTSWKQLSEQALELTIRS